MIRRGALVAGVLLAFAAPRPARAYVRALAQQSLLPTFWASSCELVTIYPNGYTGMTTDEIAKSIAAAAHAWSPETVTCPTATSDAGSGHPSFEIIPQMAAGGAAPPIGPDGKNVVIFRTDTWDYGPAIALTSRNTDPSGRIFDADIEINATGQLGFVWANLDPSSPSARGGQEQIDLQTAITHEFGHFLGLAHTCYDEGIDPPPRPLDDQGRPSPDCIPGLPEQSAVMWYLVDYELTTKRVLTADDERGVCAIYPPGATVPACATNVPDDGCGCHTAGGRPVAGGVLLSMALLLGLRRRRR